MTPDTCSALSQIVPVLMLAVLLEGGTIDVKFRSHPTYLTLMALTIVMGFFSLVVLVIGVNQSGLGEGWFLVGWGFPAALLLAAMAHFILIGLTIEGRAKVRAKDLARVEAAAKKLAIDLQTRDSLEQNWWGRRYLQFSDEGQRLKSLR